MTETAGATALPPLRQLIDGELHAAPEDATWRLDPNTGARMQQFATTGADDVERAIAAADRVHRSGAWADLGADERATWLERLADAVATRAEESARLEAATTGVPIGTTSGLAFVTHAAFRLAAAQLRGGYGREQIDGDTGRPVEILRLPWGPAVLLVPWNAPAPMAAHKAASALAAGAPAILKPSEFAPNGSVVIAEAADEIGLPAGVLQVVHGGPSVGGQLVTDPRVRAVSFTGGLEGGRAIAAACATDLKPTQLELGGNNAVIVLPDADLDAAATGVVQLLTQLNGQWCRALGRLIVHRSIVDDLLERTLDRLATLTVGHSLDASTELGPLVHSGHRDHLEERIAALEAVGGHAHRSSTLPDLDGSFLAPTLITGVRSEDALHELFGPVGTAHEFADEAEALALANATPYGLEGYVFGEDEERALAVARRVRAGGVKVNGSSVMSLALMAPRPAWGWSGFADEGTTETIDFFCGTRVVGVEGAPPTSSEETP